ncbi:MAG TPA: acyl-CoA dehydrogenase family protein [Phycisphaerae bacterium]|nr:acyl-CoA/acyl-ACP dehydrogenase [Phycisphaerales bacterium]HRX85072.1 acyl-CoA dehydrogenase family protein [Phycisphaerae bacterium]
MAAHTEEQRAELTRALDEFGQEYDASGAWPEKSIERMAAAGGWRWNIPARYGGDPLAHGDLLRAYAALAAGCVSTALISTQRDGAVELIATSGNEALKERLLPPLARGAFYTTVGIAQLTTSMRGGGQLMRAEPEGDGYRLNGMMPWATGAERAAWIVTGAVLADGNQILAAVPTDREGLSVDKPEPLFTLNASRTSSVHCTDFRVEPDEMLRGPAEKVLALRTPVKPLVTSACGMGVADALAAFIAQLRPGIRTHFIDVIEPLTARYEAVRAQLYGAAAQTDDPAYEAPSTDIRIAVNELLMRLALAALTLSKGSGFLLSRPIQRHVREALFFLVWSAPAAVQLETLVRLMDALEVPRA